MRRDTADDVKSRGRAIRDWILSRAGALDPSPHRITRRLKWLPHRFLLKAEPADLKAAAEEYVTGHDIHIRLKQSAVFNVPAS